MRILFVCSANAWRSPTAEVLYRKDPRLDVRSAGTRSGARRRIGPADLEWADLVLVMEQEHRTWIRQEFRGMELPDIRVLDIPDDWEFMDPALQEALRRAIDAELAGLLGG